MDEPNDMPAATPSAEPASSAPSPTAGDASIPPVSPPSLTEVVPEGQGGVSPTPSRKKRRRDSEKAKEKRARRAHKRSFAHIRTAIVTGFLLVALFAFANAATGAWRFSPRIDIGFLFLHAGLSVVSALFAFRWYSRQSVLRELQSSTPWENVVLFVFLSLSTLTTFTHHAGYHFLAWPLGTKSLAGLARSRMVHFLALSALLVPPFVLIRSRRWLDWVLPALFIGAELLCAWALLDLTGGAAVYADDHPSFLFRIHEFWQSHPWRENYVPQWNAGVVNNVLTSSGVVGYALLTAPLRLFSTLPHETHTAGLFLVQAGLVPWLVVWGMRANGFAWRAAWTAGLLALFANRAFFLWTFHFGTVGFGTAVAMLPATFLFLYAVAEKRFVTVSNVAGLVFSATFLCQWPPMGMAAAGLALAALTSCRRWLTSPRALVALVFSGAVVAWLLVPSLRAVAGGRDLVAYTTANGRPFSCLGALRDLRLMLGDLALRVHPLVLVLGLGGLWSLQEKPLRRWLAVSMLVLFAIFSVGNELAPKMQLPRMAIAAGMLAVVPAAILTGQAWRDHKAVLVPLQTAALALLLLGIPNAAKLYNGKGDASFGPIPAFVTELAVWVRENVPEGSRLLFAGRTRHAFGHAHVAYLPLLAGREMMACDYYDFPPGTFEPDYPPKASRGEPGGSHAFMVRHGVSHVITYRQNYIDWFRSEPEHFEEVAEFRHGTHEIVFRVFRVKESHGVFLEGEGTVEADINRLRVTFPGDPPERAVVAYNWSDRLAADGPAEIAPYETGTILGRNARRELIPVRFIEIRPHGAREVDIRYEPRF